MKLIQCKDCGIEFNLFSPEKERAGGLINQCVDSDEEINQLQKLVAEELEKRFDCNKYPSLTEEELNLCNHGNKV